LAAEAGRAAPPGRAHRRRGPSLGACPARRAQIAHESEMDSASPFAGILVGQPTLNRSCAWGSFAALDQRIATRFSIKAMDLGESAAYLRHHLKLAGREEPLFADDAVARLHRVSNGLPRALQPTPPPRRSSPLPPKQGISSTTACAKKAAPSSPGTDRCSWTQREDAMVIEACRAVLTERCRLMCKQRGRQHPITASANRDDPLDSYYIAIYRYTT